MTRTQETVVGACYHCGTSWRSGWLFCKNCGLDRERALLRSTSMPAQPTAIHKSFTDELAELEKVTCKRCGSSAKPYSRFCESCGATLEQQRDAPTTGKLRTPPAAASLRTQIDTPPPVSQPLHVPKLAAPPEPRYDPRATQGDPPQPTIKRHISPEGGRRQTVAIAESGYTRDMPANDPPARSEPAPRHNTAPFAATARVRRSARTVAAGMANTANRISKRWSGPPSPAPAPAERPSKWPLIGFAAMVLLAITTVVWGWKYQTGGGTTAPDPVPALQGEEDDSLPVNPAAGVAPPASASPASAAPAAPAGMVYIPGGPFEMGRNEGDDIERPAHNVTVKPFFMDRTEVTNEAYLRFVETNDHRPPPDWPNGRFVEGQGRLPVVNVTFEDADAYARSVGKRLPTEAEWEFAARGADGRLYPWGNEWNRAFANADQGVDGRLVEVGGYLKGASPYGVLDLCGNVWEWTASELRRYSDRAEIAPGRVIRGGAANAGALTSTTTYRGVLQTGKAYARTGFRCVRDLK
jgi:gamma-glutamyl hercynylcysteine S-oxide synthase